MSKPMRSTLLNTFYEHSWYYPHFDPISLSSSTLIVCSNLHFKFYLMNCLCASVELAQNFTLRFVVAPCGNPFGVVLVLKRKGVNSSVVSTTNSFQKEIYTWCYDKPHLIIPYYEKCQILIMNIHHSLFTMLRPIRLNY